MIGRRGSNASAVVRGCGGRHHVTRPRVKDDHKFWYKPHVSREEAIALVRDRPVGTFVVRDSHSFPGAFGLALKVAGDGHHKAPPEECVRHFLIEPTSKGVRLKGYLNEPAFASLSALVYQHSLTPLALPTALRLPKADLVSGGGGNDDDDVAAADNDDDVDEAVDNTSTARASGNGSGNNDINDGGGCSNSSTAQMQQLLDLGAACNVLYLFSMSTDTLTGPAAVQRTVAQMLLSGSGRTPPPIIVHFKVSSQGITLTDNDRKAFFRKHFATNSISHCGLDPDGRKWRTEVEAHKVAAVKGGARTGGAVASTTAAAAAAAGRECRIFGFVARKLTSKSGHNQCHVFAEKDPDQPARAIVNFINKVLLIHHNPAAMPSPSMSAVVPLPGGAAADVV